MSNSYPQQYGFNSQYQPQQMYPFQQQMHPGFPNAQPFVHSVHGQPVLDERAVARAERKKKKKEKRLQNQQFQQTQLPKEEDDETKNLKKQLEELAAEKEEREYQSKLDTVNEVCKRREQNEGVDGKYSNAWIKCALNKGQLFFYIYSPKTKLDVLGKANGMSKLESESDQYVKTINSINFADTIKIWLYYFEGEQGFDRNEFTAKEAEINNKKIIPKGNGKVLLEINPVANIVSVTNLYINPNRGVQNKDSKNGFLNSIGFNNNLRKPIIDDNSLNAGDGTPNTFSDSYTKMIKHGMFIPIVSLDQFPIRGWNQLTSGILERSLGLKIQRVPKNNSDFGGKSKKIHKKKNRKTKKQYKK